MNKKFMAWLLSVVMILGMIPGVAFATEGSTDIEDTVYVAMDTETETNYATLGDGTEENPFQISTPEDLINFRDKVNAGTNYAGQYVKLMADIDLSEVENWTPIGDALYGSKYAPEDASKVFSGVFDGNNKVISNLKMSKTVGGDDPANAQANLALFGVTGEGAVIKDLTITNVTVSSDGRNVAAVVGHAHKTELVNITVNGDIAITGGHYVAGICGLARTMTSASNLTVCGNDGSAITGSNIVGGIFPEITSDFGKLPATELSVENVAITGVSGVGGILGLLTNSAISDVSVKDVVITGKTFFNDDPMGRIRMGSVVGLMGSKGPSTISNVNLDNVTGKNLDGDAVTLPVIGANYTGSTGNATEARIGDEYYATLATAISKAESGDTIELLADITIAADAIAINDGNGMETTTAVQIGEGITLDGNNHTLTVSPVDGTGTWASGVYMTGGTLKNLTIVGGNRGVLVNRPTTDVVLDGVSVSNSLYALNSNAEGVNGPVKLTVTNSTFNGWSSISGASISEVSFENCAFGWSERGEGKTDYAYLRPYCTATLTNCTFAKGYEVDASRAQIVFKGCALDNVTVSGCAAIASEDKTVTYLTLQDAINVASKGDTIVLMKDGELTETVTVDKTVTLDLNGYTITNNTTAPITISGGNLTVMDSSEAQTGAIIATSTGENDTKAAILFGTAEGTFTLKSGKLQATKYGVRSANKLNNTIVIDGGTIEAPSGGYGVYANTGSVTMNGGQINGGTWGIAAYGEFTMNGGTIEAEVGYVSNGSNDGTVAVINGGTIKGTVYSGVYWPSAGSLTITGGSISGYSGVILKSGSLSISGGTLHGWGAKEEYKYVVSGGCETGDALMIDYVGVEGYEAITSVSITGGIFTSKYADAVGSYAATSENPDAEVVTGFITGGSFTEDSIDAVLTYVADGYAEVWNEATGMYDISVAVAAKIGSASYYSLQDAVNAAKSGQTIVLQRNVKLTEAVVIPEDKTITLELNGKDLIGLLNVITNNGTLIINDSEGTANVYTTDVAAQGRAAIINNGTMTINSGWYGDSNNDTTDRNAINRGNAVKNYGDLTINGGYFTNVSNQYIDYSAFAYAINNMEGGSVVIKNATIYGDINGLIFSDGKTVVYGGSFTLGRPNEENNLWYMAYGDVEIYGGTWTRAFAVPSWNTENPRFYGDVMIYDGTFSVDPTGYVAPGYVAEENEDGTYGIIDVRPYVLNDEKYATLAEAVAAANAGDEITMRCDAVEASAAIVDKKLSLDLNGYSITPVETWTSATAGSDALIVVNHGGELTVKDSSEDQTGTINAGEVSAVYGAVKMTNKDDTNETNAAVLNIYGGELKGYYYGICGNGNPGRGNTEINIYGGVVTTCVEDGTGIYHPQIGTVNVMGGEIESATGIEMRSGNLNVTGGTITSTASPAASESNQSGTTIDGAAVAISQHTTGNEIHVNISGGKLVAEDYALYEAVNTTDAVWNEDNTISISGGYLTGKVYSENLKGFISGGFFSTRVNTYVVAGYQVAKNDDGWFILTPKTYSVTFAGYEEDVVINLDFGTSMQVPEENPVLTGHTFVGWQNLPETMPAEDLTIYPEWIVNEYTMTFQTDMDGDDTWEEYYKVTDSFGTEIQYPADPEREGYTFAGWEMFNVVADELPTNIPAVDVVFRATWTVNQYTITFVLNNGDEDVTMTQDYGTSVVAPTDFAKDGYKFFGWDTEIPDTMPAEDLTITAQWQKIVEIEVGAVEDVYVMVGEEAVFSVEVSGDVDEIVSYQWQWAYPNGSTWYATSFTGYNTDTLTIPADKVTLARDGYQYRCVITTSNDEEYIAEAGIIDVSEPEVVVDVYGPEDVYVMVGEDASFSVEVEVENTKVASYQWQWAYPNGSTWYTTSFTGYNTDTLTIPADKVTLARDGYQYRCVVTTADGETYTTEPAVIYVSEPEVIVDVYGPEDVYAVVGEEAVFSVEVEVENTEVTSYQWQWAYPNGSTWYTTSFTGNKTDTLTIPAGRVTLARDGYQYRCVVTTADGETYTTEPAIIYISEPEVIVDIYGPEDVYAVVGEEAVFSVEVEVEYTEIASYQWQWAYPNGSTWYTTSFTGNKTDTLTIPAGRVTLGRDGYQYRCVLTTTDGETYTTEAAVIYVTSKHLSGHTGMI